MLSNTKEVSQDAKRESLPQPLCDYSNTNFTYNCNNYVSQFHFKRYLLHVYTYFNFLVR